MSDHYLMIRLMSVISHVVTPPLHTSRCGHDPEARRDQTAGRNKPNCNILQLTRVHSKWQHVSIHVVALYTESP